MIAVGKKGQLGNWLWLNDKQSKAGMRNGMANKLKNIFAK
jgi:hypothetical protein